MAMSVFPGSVVLQDYGEALEQAVDVGDAHPAGDERKAVPVDAAAAGLEQAHDLQRFDIRVAELR